MRALFRGGITAALVLLTSAAAQAQVFTPTYTSPRLLNEMGLYLSSGPGDLAIEGIWRGGPLGLRVGYADTSDGHLMIGGELRSPLVVTGAPLGLAFTAGGQVLIGDDTGAGVQAGLTAGHTFLTQGMAITPYMHPRIGAVNRVSPVSDWGLEVMADIGVDFEFNPNLILRLGLGLGSVGADWGLGFSVRR